MQTSIQHESTYEMPSARQLAAAQAWVNTFAEIWADPQPERLRELMNEDTRNLIPPMEQPGDREAVVAHFKAVVSNLPDLRLSIVRWAPVGDSVILEWEATATLHPDMGRPLTWRGIDRVSLRNGKTYEAQIYWDTRRLAEQVAAARKEAEARALQK